MSLSVSLDTSRLDALLKRVPENRDKAVLATAEYVLENSQKTTAYKNRTGNLRASGRVNQDYAQSSGFVNVEYTAEYAPFVELGTSRMGARPFLTPAVERGAAKLRQMLKEGLIK